MRRTSLLLALLLSVTRVSAQDSELRANRTLSGSLQTGDANGYTFQAQKGEFVAGSVDQVTVDVVVTITGPGGEAIATIDGPARGAEFFQFETQTDGTYRIEITPFEEETGDYTIRLDLLEPIAQDPEDRVDQLMNAYDRDDSPGVAVNIWRDGKTLFRKAYGMANLSYGIPFKLDTPTNIGSTSKQFTAFAVMLLVEEGELSLDDDVREHITELPDLGEVVTVRNLLTHTTGYREFLNLVTMSGRRLDHGDFIDRQELIDIVQRQPALQNSPGSEFNYNNTAFGLAAVLVERLSGQDFPDFMQERVFGPVGMTATQVRPSPESIIPGRSEGYSPGPAGAWLEIGDLGGAMGAGGIYSTVGDLQKWIENYAEPLVGSRSIFDQMMTSYVLTTGDSTGYGFGLSIDEQRGLTRIHHGGADVAHRSQLAYFPDINAGLTTQSNHAGFDGSIPWKLSALFFGDDMEAEVKEAPDSGFDPAAFDPEDFDEYVGRYALDAAPAFVLTFTRDGDQLFTQATGQAANEIFPVSETTFELHVVEASVTFNRDEDGNVTGLTLHQNGDQPATRLDDADDSEGPWEPSVADLEAFTGRYFSEEIETFYTLVIEDESLVMKQRRMAGGTLTAGERDSFTGAGFSEMAFERDRNGEVIGLYVANGRTRDVRFRKLTGSD